MISHRVSTHRADEPPVKFYKFIALSFLIVTIFLLGIIIFVTSKKAEIIIVAKEDVRDISLTMEVAAAPAAGSIVGSVSSTIFRWSEKYFPTGNKKVESVARGEVVLHNLTAAAQPLVKTTRLITAEGVLFRLTNRVVVPAMGQITAEVYADQPGRASEIGPSKFLIPGLLDVKQKLIYAESVKPMTGGEQAVGILTADDIKNAETDYQEKAKAAFLATLTKRPGEEIIVTLTEQNVSSDHEAGEEVGEFVISGTNQMVAVGYKPEDLSNLENQKLADKIDSSAERFLSLDKKPEISVASYNLAERTAELTVRQSVVVTLDANVDKLAPRNFLGKRKDEIERYLLGLDHVANVKVEFSPIWASSAPTVPDRIRVIVKNVK